MLRAMTLGQAVFASVALASHFYPATAIGVSEPDRAYEFSVCSGGGGAQGVDFRSHFSVYGAEHGIKGWVRNACNNCVYGEFSGASKPVEALAKIMRSPDRVLKELASKAFNVTTSVSKKDLKCKTKLPKEYLEATVVQVDWAMAKSCLSPCSCMPTGYTDCQQTTPLPAGVKYTKDCQRAPLGNTTKNFCDCNSVHQHPKTDKACFGIHEGEIVPTGACTGDWVALTFAAQSCCGAEGSAEGGRQGRPIPPAPAACSAYSTDEGYQTRCPKKPRGWVHPLE